MPTIFHKAKVNTLEMNGKIDVLSREILKRTTEFVILYRAYKNYRKTVKKEPIENFRT